MTDPAMWLRERAHSYDLDSRRLTDPDERWLYQQMRDELNRAAKTFETNVRTVDRMEAEPQ